MLCILLLLNIADGILQKKVSYTLSFMDSKMNAIITAYRKCVPEGLYRDLSEDHYEFPQICRIIVTE